VAFLTESGFESYKIYGVIPSGYSVTTI
jgi:hypothetical protein